METGKKILTTELESFEDLMRLGHSGVAVHCHELNLGEFIYYVCHGDRFFSFVKTDITPKSAFLKYHRMNDSWEFVQKPDSEGQCVIYPIIRVKNSPFMVDAADG